MKTVDLLAAISRVMGHGSGPATPPASPPVDVPIALRAVDGDTLLLKELVDLFAADYPQRLAEVREALGSGDARRVQQTAHGLKGALGSLGATEAANLAAKLETAGRDRQLILAPTLLQSLEAEIDRVLAFFAEPEPGLQPLE
jgi:HPt (histidine-containing phosphotransfer) domain-containing protein